MADPQRIAITVHRRKRVEQFELWAGALRVGSAAHCDIRLAPDEAAPEQLTLSGDTRGLRLQSCSPEHNVRVDGAPLTAACIVTGDAAIEIGLVRLTLRLLAEPQRVDQRASWLKKLRQVAQLVAIAIAYYVVLYEEPQQSAFQRSVAPPQLFAELESAPCRQREPASAEAFAAQQLVAADNKRERAPYAERDGVLAVRLYAEAAACFRTAGLGRAAEESLASAQRLASRLQDDLHGHQVRLEWALGQHRYLQAVQELQVLRALVADRNDSHASWLAAVARELRALPLTP